MEILYLRRSRRGLHCYKTEGNEATLNFSKQTSILIAMLNKCSDFIGISTHVSLPDKDQIQGIDT